MIARIDLNTIDVYQCFTTIDKAVEYLCKLYESHEAEVQKNYYDDVDDEFVIVIRYHNNSDEFIMSYIFIEIKPIA